MSCAEARFGAAILGLGLVACGLVACSGSAWPDGLESVDHPDLDAVEASARSQLQAPRDELAGLLERGRGDVAELAAAYGTMGRLYHAYRLNEPAAACYRNAERLDSGSFLWPYYQGLLAEAAGRFADARVHFEHALELGPDNGPAQLRLGGVYLALNDVPAARAAFEPLVGDGRYAPAALAGLGRAAVAEGAFELAVENFRKALAERPEAGSVHHALAMALRRLDRLDEAEAHLEKRGSGEIDFPDPLAERLGQLATSSGSFLRRANRALVNGRIEEAIEAYGRAVDADPQNVAARRNLALALVRHGRAGDAVAHLEAALQLTPDDAQLHADLGNAQRAVGAVEAAIAAYRKSVELAGDVVASRFNLANVLAQQERWAEAAEHLEKILELEPNHSRARYLGAMARHHQGQTGEAVARLERLARDEPESPVALQGLAAVHAASGRPERALDAYRRALELDLEAEAAGRLLEQAAQLAWRRGRRQQAIEFFRRGVLIEPESSAAVTRLANALQLADQRDEAVRLFARAVELDPKNAAAWLSEASLRILAGDYAEAVRRLEQALDAVGQHVGLSHTLARLLATSPDAGLRDGTRALALARQAQSAAPSLEHASTIAMALAELGRFQEAAEWQRSLIRQAGGRTPPAVRQQLLGYLKLYESARPVRIGE